MNMPSADTIYQLRFWLKHVSPCIWRRLLVKDSCTVADLHAIIQIAMGWSDTYLHQFSIHGKSYGIAHNGGITFSDNPHAIFLKDFQFYPNERFIYEYNFFAQWELEIRVEKFLSPEKKKTYPICIGGRRTAPLEDCGGPLEFMELADHYSCWHLEEMLLETINYYQSKEADNEWEERLETIMYWLNQPSFNRRYVNNVLKKFSNNDPGWKDYFE